MRTILTTGLAFILIVNAAYGQMDQGSEPTSGAQISVPTTLKYLNERIPQVAFQDAALESVIDWLGKQTPMQVQVRWQILEDAGIERDRVITMNVHDLRLSQILWMILKEAGGADLRLAYRASDRILTISTAEDLGQEMIVRVYDVSDLLHRVPDYYGAPQMDIAQAQGMGGSGGGGSNIFTQGGSSNSDEEERQQSGRPGEEDPEIQALIELITLTVEPDSWEDHGGKGTIKAFRKLLVVRNNILVHQALGGYVEEND